MDAQKGEGTSPRPHSLLRAALALDPEATFSEGAFLQGGVCCSKELLCVAYNLISVLSALPRPQSWESLLSVSSLCLSTRRTQQRTGSDTCSSRDLPLDMESSVRPVQDDCHLFWTSWPTVLSWCNEVAGVPALRST